MTGLASHLPAFYGFLALSVLPLVGRLLSLGDRLHLIMGAMMTVFVVAMLVIGRSYNRSLTRGLQLAEENRRLLASRESEVRARTADLVAANSRLRDEIVERQRAERALDEARAEAVCANQAKSRFLAAASHDLRQPMQSMFLFCQALRYHLPDDKGRAALLMLERGLNTLRDLLDSLLDVSRLDVNVTRTKLTGFPLRPLLGEIVDAYGPIAATKGLQVGIAPMPEVHVTSDRHLLGRMVRNLVENAVRYTERGQVTVACRSIDDKLRIEVCDTGIGIPAEQLGRIFEEFHQVANPERDKSRGLGLGLAIVQRLSVILGHRVEVRSELGKGSVFSIELDRAAGASAAPGMAAEEADGDVDIGQQGQGKMIVVVDDDPMVLLGLRDVLERWGYEVVIADGADQALARLGSPARRPALVVADYRLRSGRVGTEAIERIRALSGTAVPGIILTGETGDECRNEASQHSFDLLHKPVSSHQLAFVLKNLAGV